MDLTELQHMLRSKNPNLFIYVDWSDNDDCFKFWIGAYDENKKEYNYLRMFDNETDLTKYVLTY